MNFILRLRSVIDRAITYDFEAKETEEVLEDTLDIMSDAVIQVDRFIEKRIKKASMEFFYHAQDRGWDEDQLRLEYKIWWERNKYNYLISEEKSDDTNS